MHRTRLPLGQWLQAILLLASSSKGISARKLGEMLGLTYKVAWHLCHRIRSMMSDRQITLSGMVEIDEIYAGAPPRKRTTGDEGRLSYNTTGGMPTRGFLWDQKGSQSHHRRSMEICVHAHPVYASGEDVLFARRLSTTPTHICAAGVARRHQDLRDVPPAPLLAARHP